LHEYLFVYLWGWVALIIFVYLWGWVALIIYSFISGLGSLSQQLQAASYILSGRVGMLGGEGMGSFSEPESRHVYSAMIGCMVDESGKLGEV
jgi:hypothetical protein